MYYFHYGEVYILQLLLAHLAHQQTLLRSTIYIYIYHRSPETKVACCEAAYEHYGQFS